MWVHFIGTNTGAVLSACMHTDLKFKTGADHDRKEDCVHVFASNCINHRIELIACERLTYPS